ncbi:site-specific DNA-methyltransferase [Fusobacterium polymorphum]|jgi:site-specific DNA-methyltransferase (adenine-specific)|uniref:site-specific DNA-methyltransferase n=1 Tax=Fusobacterium nucleatum subsp. polymorphum TaxID=76857 RepID=UPI0030CAA553
MELENKVPEQLDSIKSDNLKTLQKLFPSVIKDGQLDLEALKEEIGNFEEVKEEKYDFIWAGKKEAKKKAQETIVARTLNLIEKDSVNLDNTENLYIEGDNLEVLKLLRQNYRGAIKMIYIDPPYNTGNEFVYNDNFKISQEESDKSQGYIDEKNQKLQKKEKESNKTHSKWLSMMYPRLRIARDLLSEDGVIFISIDDAEVTNLKKICDEIFGEENFVEIFSWEKTSTPPNLSNKTKKSVEYLLCYEKEDCKVLKGLKKSSKSTNGLMNQSNSIKILNFPHEKIETSIKNEKFKKGIYGTKNYEIELLNDTEVKNGKFLNDILLKGKFKWKQDYLDEQIKNGVKIYIKTNALSPSYDKEEYEAEKPWNFIDSTFGVGTNENATSEVNTLFKENFSNKLYPKPVSLVSYILKMLDLENEMILDFFSGSATTADAVMQLNAEDGGNRKFIMVQIDEPIKTDTEAYKFLNAINKPTNICEIGKERIRRAGEKIKTEIEENNKKVKDGEELKEVPDIGFKVFRTADTNINWRNIRNISNYTDLPFNEPDRLDFIENYNDKDVVYEVLLHQRDLPLSEKLEVLSAIGDRTYLYASSYLVCLETNITETLIKELANLNPLPVKFIFRDSAFKSDINLKESTFRYLKTLVEKNSGMNKRTYTIEFI